MKKLLPLLLAVFLIMPISAQAETVAEQRASIQEMKHDVLARLYKEKPNAQREIEEANGYAVFTTGELAVLYISAGGGHGVATNNETGNETYMKMAKAGVGLGFGAKDADIVFIFNTAKAYNDFIETGLDLTGTADAAVKNDSKGDEIGGGASVLPNVRIYQMTDTGVMAQAMLQGTKYWKDAKLNRTTYQKDGQIHQEEMN